MTAIQRRRMAMMGAAKKGINIFDPMDFYDWCRTIKLTQGDRATLATMQGRSCISLNGTSMYKSPNSYENYYMFSNSANGKTYRVEFDKLDVPIVGRTYVFPTIYVLDSSADRLTRKTRASFPAPLDITEFTHYSFTVNGFVNGTALLYFSYVTNSNNGHTYIDIDSFKIYEL